MDYIKRYKEFLVAFLKPVSTMKIVIDSSNGGTGPILKELFRGQEKIETVFINDKPDGNFPNHGPNPEYDDSIKELSETVRNERADMGIIFDADGDRVFLIDEMGDRVNATETFLLLSRNFTPPFLVNVSNSKTVMSWFGVFDVIESRTGIYFMKQAMKKNNTEFGGEVSGHYYFKDFFGADSGILAAILAINEVSIMRREKGTLSQWRNGLPVVYRTGEINIQTEYRDSAIERVEEYYKKNDAKISHLDGVTAESENYWINIRKSNTEPMVRINVATKDKLLLKEIKENVARLARGNR